MGEVWLASHTTLGEKVAIKFLLHKEGPGEDDYATARKRFLFEAQAAAKLSRKTRHVVRVTDHGEDGDLTYLVMELLDGDSLDDYIKRAGPQGLPFAAEVMGHVARGLAQAHGDGVFHRDLKPANIYLVKDEDDRRLVKILDFGLARTYGSPQTTARGIVLGSPSYMSPEQARGLPNLDYRCDLWAMACVVYKTLTGELPFGSISAEDALARIVMSDFTPARDHRPDLPWEVDAFFARAFAKKIDDRFENAMKMAAALEKLARPADSVKEVAAPRLPGPMTDPAPALAPAPGAAPAGAERHDSDGTHSGATTSQGSVSVKGLPRPLATRLLIGGVIAVPAVLVLVFAAMFHSRGTPPAVPSMAPGSPGSVPLVPAPPPSSPPGTSADSASAASTAVQASATPSTASRSIPSGSHSPGTQQNPRSNPRPSATSGASTTAPTSTAPPTRRGNQDEVF